MTLPPAVIASITGLCALWGLGQIMIKIGNSGISPLMQAGLRSAGAAVLVALWMWRRRTPLFMQRQQVGPIIVIGLLFAAEFLFLFQGLARTTASRGTLLLYTAPFVVALGGHLMLDDRLAGRQWLGLVLAFVGLIVMMSSRPGTAGALAALPPPAAGTLAGDLMCLAAGVLWGATTMVIRATSLRREPADRCLFYQLALSAPLLIGLSLLLGASRGEPGIHALTPAVIGALAYQILVIAAASYLAWFHLILRYSPGRLSAFTFLTPLFGVLFAAPILGEPLYPGLVAALALCMTGLWLVNRRRT
jgi:drug/metabolite transporter (DMT)-like permease